MPPTRIVLIGCGFFARNHLNAWRDLAPDAELVAVCDIDRDKAQAAASDFNVPAWYDNVDTMLAAETIDLVDIATRMDTHRELAERTLERGIGTIVQKPFAPTWEDCVAICDAARTSNTFLAVHENFRFQAPMRRLAEIIGEGRIGTPSWARISFRTGYDVYANQPYFYDEERFSILDIGIHVLDVARVLMGEVRHLSCEAQTRNPKVRAEDTATMLIKHDSGAVSVVEHTYEARREPDPFPQTEVIVEADRGALALRPGGVIEVTADGDLTREEIRIETRPWMDPRWAFAQASVVATCRHLLERFRAGQPADTSGEDNLRTYGLVEAAYEAAATGRAVAPRDNTPDQ